MAASAPPRDAGDLVLADGRPVRVRPLGPGDRGELAAAFLRLSAQSRNRRFLGPKLKLTERELSYFTDIDHVGHEALAAIDETSGRILAVARYATWRGRPGTADVAVTVADELQGHGLGTMLTRRLVERARANGLERLMATTSWDNRAARALVRRLGFRASASAGPTLDLELALACPERGGLRPARARTP